MNKFKLAVLILVVAALSFLAGHWSRQKSSPGATAQARRILYYVDPMHPAYKSDKPGVAPDCGMELEPVYADDPAIPGSAAAVSLPVGTVQITPQKQQLMGVQVTVASNSTGQGTLRTVGRVIPDENRIYRIVTGTEGWIREIHGGTTGSVVEKDQLLATLYNRDFLTAEQGLIYVLNSLDRFKKEGMDSPEQVASINNQAKAAEDSLHALGMGEAQIQEITRTRKLTRDIAVTAPVTGLVLARNVFPGLRFERSTELYRIVDLSRVWILADVFENEAGYYRPGTRARVTLVQEQKSFDAVVSAVPPQFDPASRTLKIRLEANNPGFVMRPDMFVDVELSIKLPAGVSVPVDAVLNSGLRKTVFVDHGNGLFEPRQVETGWRMGDRVEIVKGLMAGERLVVDGNFFLDSESRLKAAAAGIHSTAAQDPVCGMAIDQNKAAAAGRKTDYRGTTYFFCSDQCRRNFENDPARYADKPTGTAGASRVITKTAQAKPESGAGTVKDPACGMAVDAKKAASAGLQSEYRGVTYYFCSQGCKRNFDKAPDHYLKKSPNAAAGGGAQ